MKIKVDIREILARIYLNISGICFYGNNYRCSCCNKTFRRFLNFNYKLPIYNKEIYDNIYINTVCPYCLSLPRHRIICEYLNMNKDILKNKKILLFAPERGMKQWLRNNDLEFVTADLYKKADLKIDITKTMLEDSSFDIIFCNHVLEHVNNYDNALKEINRILKKDGILICSVPIDTNSITTIEKNVSTEEERKKIYGQSDHFRNFGLDIAKQIAKNGFLVEDIDGNKFDEKIRPVIGPGKYDYNHIFICHNINSR